MFRRSFNLLANVSIGMSTTEEPEIVVRGFDETSEMAIHESLVDLGIREESIKRN